MKKAVKKQLVFGTKLHKRIKVVKPGLDPGILLLIFHTPPTGPPPTDRFTTLAVKVILIHLTVMAVLSFINDREQNDEGGCSVQKLETCVAQQDTIN